MSLVLGDKLNANQIEVCELKIRMLAYLGQCFHQIILLVQFLGGINLDWSSVERVNLWVVNT